ncbi:MAG: serine/threonine protein kinase [bacterium]|nr:serine/threonine protein kinase [bacterium]
MDSEALFHAALAADDSEAFLLQATDDPAQRARVRALLAAHEDPSDFLEPVVTRPDFAAEAPGTMIGPYRILRLIGEGGFGAVYLAEQREPVRREVALKIIKLGMDTRRVIARFEAERQALALTDHPNVAKVLDAGATETGRPYFVMELVRGISIEKFCDAGELTLRERIELFLGVCRGVQHAHEKGLIHRDLKPSNVLVAMHGNVPLSKIIDFGIAKATHERLTDHTLSTERGQFLGTPVYMSPEQASPDGRSIDTRSDVYSLGALLYELLTGTPPFDSKRLREVGLAELQRILSQVDPPAPSVVVADGTRPDAALARSLDKDAWSSLLRGDLDWIVMKALDKDPSRRYASADALAGDLRRHLAHEAIDARPPSRRYRAAKFIRRNRIAVLAASGVTTALLVGISVAVFGFLRARDEANGFRRASEFFRDLIASSDPNLAGEIDWSVDGLLGRAREALGEDHATVAVVLGEHARQLHRSGSLDDALPFYEAALRLSQDTYGVGSLHAAVLEGQIGLLLGDLDRAEEAVLRLRNALAIESALPGQPGPLLCDARSELAGLLRADENYSEAARLLRQSVEIRERTTPNEKARISRELVELRDVQTLDGNIFGATIVAAELVAFYRTASPSNALIAREQIRNGIWMSTFLSRGQAKGQLRAGLEAWRTSGLPKRADFLNGLAALEAIVARSGDDPAESETLLVEWIEIAREVLGPNALDLARKLSRLGETLELTGRSAQAIPHVVEAIAIQKRAVGAEVEDPFATQLERLVRTTVTNKETSTDELRVARNGLEVLLGAEPERADLFRLQATLRLRLGQPQEALFSIGTAAQLRAKYADDEQDGHPVDFALMAMSYLQLGKVTDALGMLNRARELRLSSRYERDPGVKAIVDQAETAVEAAR